MRGARRSVVHGLNIMVGIDHGLDHGRAVGGKCLAHGNFQRMRAMHADGRHAEIVRRRFPIILVLQFGAVEGELAADLLDLDEREPAVVEHHDRDGEPLPLCYRDFPAGHLEAAVADQASDGQVGAREFRRNRGRQAEAHR